MGYNSKKSPKPPKAMLENVDLELIEIVVDDYELVPKTDIPSNDSGETKRWGGKSQISEDTQKQTISKSLRVNEIEQRMSVFLGMVSRIFQSAEQETQKAAGMSLDEIELSVEIGSEGEVRLIGSGAKASGKGAIKLKFKRQQKA